MGARRTLPLAHRRAMEAFGDAIDPRTLVSPEEQYASTLAQPEVAPTLLEQAAERVLGVHSCRVIVRGQDPLPARIRVVARYDRRTAVAKDIQSAWFALFGVYVPRARFEVLPVRGALDTTAGRRVALRSCAEERNASRTEVVVRLVHGEKIWEGRQSGVGGADTRQLAAEATLVALAGIVDRPVRLLAISETQVNGAEVLVAAVAAGPNEHLFGVAQVRDEPGAAAARAVLDALNRWLHRHGA